MIDTEEYYGGTYPEPPEEIDVIDILEDDSNEDFDRDVYNEIEVN